MKKTTVTLAMILACAGCSPTQKIDTPTKDIITLWDAVRNGTPADVAALLKAGAHPNARNKASETPLDYAVIENTNPAVIKALLDSGADPNIGVIPNARSNGWPPLAAAAFFNDNPAVIKALLQAGANPNVWNENGDTPLHIASGPNFAKNSADTAALLLEAGADPNVLPQTLVRWTPLHVAAAYDTLDAPAVINVLLKAGANPKAKDGEGKTPFDLAKENKSLKGTDAYLRLKP